MKAFLLFLLAFALSLTNAQAHKASLFASIENGTVYGECYFVDGSPCKSATISVTDIKTGETFFSGSTDLQGAFSFPAPKATAFKIVAEADSGHRAEYLMADTKANTSQAKETQEIEKILERVIDRKLQPLNAQLVSIRKEMERPALDRVLAGIGWIAGILGLYVLLTAKKKGP